MDEILHPFDEATGDGNANVNEMNEVDLEIATCEVVKTEVEWASNRIVDAAVRRPAKESDVPLRRHSLLHPLHLVHSTPDALVQPLIVMHRDGVANVEEVQANQEELECHQVQQRRLELQQPLHLQPLLHLVQLELLLELLVVR